MNILTKLPFVHEIQVDQVLGNRRGIIVERYGERLDAVHLLLSVTGRRPRLFFLDFKQGVANLRPVFWLRIAWCRGSGWELCRGITPCDDRVEDTGRVARIYQVKP